MATIIVYFVIAFRIDSMKNAKSMVEVDNNDDDDGDLNLLWTCFIVGKEYIDA